MLINLMRLSVCICQRENINCWYYLDASRTKFVPVWKRMRTTGQFCVTYNIIVISTVVPRYMWLLPKLQDKKITGSPDIEVHGPVRAVDGGVHLDGKESFLKVGTFDGKCLHDPSKCPNGLSLSCKLKFNRVRINAVKQIDIVIRNSLPMAGQV